MKITANSNQGVVKQEAKTPVPNQEKQAIAKSEKTSNKHEAVKSSPSAQNIKDVNINIGRLQVAQTTLKTLESDVKKIAELAKSDAKSEQKEMLDLKKKVEDTLKKATFDGKSVFGASIGDSKGKTIFDASQLNMKLLDSDPQKFYDTLKTQQTQAKDAMQTLQDDAQANTDELALKASSSQDLESTDNSFLKKFKNLFRVSHNTDKLDSKRVQELLA